MKMRVSKLFGAAFVAILLLCMITILPVARGQPPAPSFWIEPATENFTTANASVGTQFNVTVCGESSDNTLDWAVRLGFDSSELHAVSGYMSDFFAGHPCVNISPEFDNNAGNVFAAQIITGSDYVGPASGSLLCVTFEIIAAPDPGQSLTSLIDPGYGIASHLTVFVNSDYAPEAPLSTAPCAYTFCDTAACSSNPTYVSCSPNPAVANSPVTCTAAVSSLNATGTITWTSNSSTGSFNPPTCTLPSGNSSDTSATTYTDSSAGTVIITASYSGDSNNTPSNGSTILVVNAQAEQSSTYIFCSPNPAHVDGNVFCTAEVIGNNPTGTITWSSNSSTGNFSSSVCTLSSFGTCGTTYTDSSPGTVMISASYSGDSDNTPSNCSTTFLESAQALQSSVYVYCSPNPAHVNQSVTCTTYVNGFNPTGTVTWSSNSSTGSFSSSVCDLWYGDCSTTFTDSSPGTVTITTSYSGDSENAPSNGSTTVIESAQPLKSSTYVYCWPSPVPVNGSVTCTADVYGFNPTGIVTWSSNSSTGTFSPSVCNLSSEYCSTTYNDSSAGTVIITASYSGDSDNTPSVGTMTLVILPEPVLPSRVLINVPYHHQVNGYYCGPAALEEVFNFYGPDVSQREIASVERTTIDGTYDIDLVRAAEFSNMSNSAEGQSGANLNGFNGYSSRSLGYAALSCYGMSVEDLRVVLAAGYPVIVLTTWHFRVAVGYDDNCIIFQDPYYGPLYRMTYDAFSTDWDYSGHEGILVCPWQVEISNPHNVLPGVTFNVTATITYPDVYPFQASQPSSGASWVNATITLPSGLTLATGETAQKACESYFEPGQSFTVSWQVQCKAVGDYKIGVEAEGLVSGNMMAEPPDYPQSYVYLDRIGGTNDSAVAVTSALDTTPPITMANYDGSWQAHPFAINLTASDDESGVLDTCYRINGGPEQTLTRNGQPIIRTLGANNTLEYWSVDWAGNEEFPHKLLTNIKLDETPPSLDGLSFTPYTDVQPYQTVEVTVSTTDDLSGIQNVTLVYSVDDGVSWIQEAMTLNQSTLFFEATIPGQPIGTLVRFYVAAFDQAGNVANLKNEYYYSAYQIPPLRVTKVTACAWIYRGQTAYINVTFIDTGDFPEDVWVTLYCNITAGNIVDAYPVQLEVGQIYTLVFAWNTAGLPCLNYTLTVVATIPAGNATLVGGTITVRLMGDVNGDGRVDMKDIALVARAFGSNPNSPRWNAAADINCDGCVDMKEIAQVARHFGQHYT